MRLLALDFSTFSPDVQSNPNACQQGPTIHSNRRDIPYPRHQQLDQVGDLLRGAAGSIQRPIIKTRDSRLRSFLEPPLYKQTRLAARSGPALAVDTIHTLEDTIHSLAGQPLITTGDRCPPVSDKQIPNSPPPSTRRGPGAATTAARSGCGHATRYRRRAGMDTASINSRRDVCWALDEVRFFGHSRLTLVFCSRSPKNQYMAAARPRRTGARSRRRPLCDSGSKSTGTRLAKA